jgi:small subunit ribosomal protein S16
MKDSRVETAHVTPSPDFPCENAKKYRRITPFPHFWGWQEHMVVIRLARGGAKNRPFYNMVVADSRRSRDGRFVERIGFYNPKAPEGQERLRIDRTRLAYWKSKGAQMSDTVARLVKQAGEPKAA